MGKGSVTGRGDRPELMKILSSVGAGMRSRFDESASMHHRGGKGRARESIVADFIRGYGPQNISVVQSAEILATDGSRSAETDVVVCNPDVPRFFSGVHNLIPNEAVYGVIEVKSKLDKRELKSACEAIRRAKQLPKDGFGGGPRVRHRNAYGRVWDYVPTVGMIVAFDSPSLSAVGDNFLDVVKDWPIEERPDSIWILGKGCLVWAVPGEQKIDAIASVAEPTLLALKEHRDHDILYPWALSLFDCFQTAFMPPIRLSAYAPTSVFGVVERGWERVGDE